MSNARLKMDTDVEKATDTLGGGGVLDTNIYTGFIKTIYMGESAGGAMSATVVLELDDGSEFKTTQYVTSGAAKGGKPFYERNGKKYPLPGYSVIDDICQLAAGASLGDIETEEKVVKIYDYDLQKEVPEEVDCICDVKGQTIMIAIQKQLEDKTEANAAYDKDQPEGPTNLKRILTGETRETNEVSKIFSDDGATWKEQSEELEVEFGQKWLDKNKGKVRDRTSKKAGAAGSPKKEAKKKMFAS